MSTLRIRLALLVTLVVAALAAGAGPAGAIPKDKEKARAHVIKQCEKHGYDSRQCRHHAAKYEEQFGESPFDDGEEEPPPIAT